MRLRSDAMPIRAANGSSATDTCLGETAMTGGFDDTARKLAVRVLEVV